MAESLPSVPGVTTRPLADADLPKLVALGAAVLAVDGGLPLAAGEGFLSRRFLGEARTVGCFDGAFLVAAASVRPAGGLSIATALIDPAARDRGLHAELLDWALTTDGPVRVETESLTPTAAELYASRGLAQTFAEDVLRCDLGNAGPWPVIPEGITLTGWDSPYLDRFFAVYEAAFRDRPGFPGWSLAEWVDWHTGDDDFAPEWTFLATDADGRDVGFIACARGAWIVQVGVIPAARGTGLGAALTGEALRRMAAVGATEVLLDVNINNPGAARIYDRLGFVHIGRRARYEHVSPAPQPG